MSGHRPITKLLVANRGEIARRVFAACRRMGIATVAVYSEPDSEAPFVGDADEAVPLGGTTAAESYLRTTALIEAAERSGADAIHPGYGFLAENAEFAAAVEAAGLIWVGSWPGGDRGDGLEAQGPGDDRARRRAGAARGGAARGIRSGGGGRADRLPAARQGVGRRRRQGDADGPRAG